MRRTFFIYLCLLSFVCFWSCSKENSSEAPEYITIAIYDGTPQLEYFTQILDREWKEAGHKEELRVIPWDNYDGLPDSDASLLIYDGVFYSALRAKGIIQPLSSHRNCSYDWTYTPADGAEYVEPFLLCSSFLIFDKDDDVLSKVRYITDVTQETAVPLSSMCAYYYISNLIAKEGPSYVLQDLTQHIDSVALAPVKHMYDNWLGSIKFEDARLSRYNGPERFNGGSVSGIYNFSETAYDLSSTNLSMTLLAPFTDVAYRAFNVDYMSIRQGVTESTAKLCEELIAIISSDEFQFEYVDHNGKVLFCLPANKAAFCRLADKYPIYSTLLKYSSSDLNRPMVLGPGFYEEMNTLEEKIKSLLSPLSN